MRTLAFVQARLGSSRLPGKVLEPLAGRPAIVRVLERVAETPGIDGVALLTTDAHRDEPLRALGRDLGIAVVAGSEHDVLDRFHHAAQELQAETILRVTADCPLSDPEVLGDLLALFESDTTLEYAAVATGAMAARRGLLRYPDGLDGELVSAAALALAWEHSENPYEREHVTPFVWSRPARFRAVLLQAPEELGEERWTVDHPRDLDFMRAVYERLADTGGFGYREVLELLRREPALRELNAHERASAVPVR